VLIYFQDVCPRDIEIATRFSLDYHGGPNCGIADGMRNGATKLGTDYVLFLENDCPVIEDRNEVERQLKPLSSTWESGTIDIMRLRSRLRPGESFMDIPKYLRYYTVREKEPLVDIEPFHAETRRRWLRRIYKRHNLNRMKGRAVYLEQAAEKLFPEVIQKTEDGIWIMDSCCADWTNQSVLCRRDFFLDVLMPYVDAHPSSRTSNGFQEPERPLNCRWWRRQHFKIGQGKGLFTHRRVDGSWRTYHPAFEDTASHAPGSDNDRASQPTHGASIDG
jgi:hypothetical protein